MTAAEKSFIGIAKQTGVGVRNVTDAQFKYLLFRAGGVAPQNIVIPLDAEVGGGAMLRDMAKVGVTSGGALDIIPRPDTMGTMLYGALGQIDARAHQLSAERERQHYCGRPVQDRYLGYPSRVEHRR